MTARRLTTAAAARSVRDSFRLVVGTRAGCKTAAAIHREGLRDLVTRAQAFDRIARAAASDDLSAADLCAVVYQQVSEAIGSQP